MAWHHLSIPALLSVDNERQKIAIYRKTRAQCVAIQLRKCTEIAHQKVRRAKSSRRYHQALASYSESRWWRTLASCRIDRFGIVPHKLDLVSHAIKRRDGLYFAQRFDSRGMRILMDSRRDVRVVESVLAAVITADITLTAETTSRAKLIAFRRHRVIVGLIFINLRSEDWRVRGIVFIGTGDLLTSEANR